MAKRGENLTWWASKLNGGINYQTDLAAPNECADARNVWAPEGKVVQRPKAWCVGKIHASAALTGGTYASFTSVVIEHPIGTFSAPAPFPVAINGLGQGDKIYLGYTPGPVWPPPSSIEVETISFSEVAGAVLTVAGIVEYFNGAEWVPFPVGHQIMESFGGAVAHICQGVANPQDACQTIVNGMTTMIRVSLVARVLGATIGAGASLIDSSISYVGDSGQLFAKQLQTCPTKVLFVRKYAANEMPYLGSTGIHCDYHWSVEAFASAGVTKYDEYTSAVEIAGYATALVPSISGTLHMYNIDQDHNRYIVLPGRYYPTALLPEENPNRFDPLLRSYDQAMVAQDAATPSTGVMAYVAGRLWAGVGKVIQWSAPSPWHFVWPAISKEPLVDAQDTEDITAIAAIGQTPVVFKRDAIWIMVPDGVNDRGLARYRPQRIAWGVGCNSQASITAVPGALFFSGENGVYTLDASFSVSIISSKIRNIFLGLTRGTEKNRAGVYWSSMQCFLLSVAYGGSADNNMVLVYHTPTKAWWIWDGFNAQTWLLHPSAPFGTELMFASKYGILYRMSQVKRSDSGTTVVAYLKTHPIGIEKDTTKTMRQLQARCNTLNDHVHVYVYPDEGEAFTYTNTISFVKPAETSYRESSRKWRALDVSISAETFVLKIEHNAHNESFELSELRAGWLE